MSSCSTKPMPPAASPPTSMAKFVSGRSAVMKPR